jgi:hypothetical protein
MRCVTSIFSISLTHRRNRVIATEPNPVTVARNASLVGESGVQHSILRRSVAASAVVIWFVASAHTLHAQETCGLQTASFDIIFADAFDPPPAGLGPVLGSVVAPTLGIAPTVSISYPPSSTTLVGGTVQVAGTVTGPVDTGVVVNGIRAYVFNGQFLTPPFNVDTSTTSLDAQATTLDGLTATASVGVMSVAGAPVTTLTTANAIGFSPLPLRFDLRSNVAQTVQSVHVDYGDSTSFDGTVLGYLPTHTYSSPGVYTAIATITFASGPPQTASTMAIALSLPEQRNALCTVYSHLRAQLAANHVSNATQALMGDLSTRLTPFFQALSANNEITGVAAQLGTLAAGTIGLDSADIVAVRDVSGQLLGYPVHFARGSDGVWRIDSM